MASDAPTAEKTTRGSCLCGKLQFEMVGTTADYTNCLCFCNSCRKITGSVGMANSWCRKENFKFLTGTEELRIFEDKSCDSGGTIHRGFCATCGSTMISENRSKFPGDLIVPSGALDVDPLTDAWQPNMEFFVKRKSKWFSTPEDTTKYTELF